jgi:hypothetical protein
MRDDSLVERSWARIWGAPFVALLAGLIVAFIYVEWMSHDPPTRVRARALAKCRKEYEGAVTSAESTRVDLIVAIPKIARSATRDLTCQELRAGRDW